MTAPPQLPPVSHVTARRARTVAEAWYPVWEYELDHRRRDGVSQELTLQVCHRTDSVAVLLYTTEPATVTLVRQFRLPPLLNGHANGLMLEAAGGVIDGRPAAEAAVQEVLEETGYQLTEVEHVATVYPTPCLVTEKVHLFLADINAARRVTDGGGLIEEGEDIETIEFGLDEAVAMARRGDIVDVKTVLMLLTLHGRLRPSLEPGT